MDAACGGDFHSFDGQGLTHLPACGRDPPSSVWEKPTGWVDVPSRKLGCNWLGSVGFLTPKKKPIYK